MKSEDALVIFERVVSVPETEPGKIRYISIEQSIDRLLRATETRTSTIVVRGDISFEQAKDRSEIFKDSPHFVPSSVLGQPGLRGHTRRATCVDGSGRTTETIWTFHHDVGEPLVGSDTKPIIVLTSLIHFMARRHGGYERFGLLDLQREVKQLAARAADNDAFSRAATIAERLARTQSDVPQQYRIIELYGALHAAFDYAALAERARSDTERAKATSQHRSPNGCLTVLSAVLLVLLVGWICLGEATH